MSSHGSNPEVFMRDERVNDPEALRVQRFMEVLPLVSTVNAIVPDTQFDQENPIRFAEKRFMAFEYEGEPTLFVNPTCIEVPEDKKQTPWLSFEPLVARGGKRSMHGVFFGVLVVNEARVPVAVKPHEANFRTGLDDYFKTHAITEQGFYTLTPAALLLPKDHDEPAYSMTLLQEGLTTLDSIDWSDYFPNIDMHPGMKEIWREISGQSAVLHAEGNRSHGDLAARNIATNFDGAAFFIDWETARIGGEPPRDAEVRFNHSYADLSVLVESMCLPPHANIGGKAGIGIFYGKEGDWWEGFCDVFFDEYVEVRLALAKVGNHHGQTLRDVQEELDELARTLKEDINMMRAICESILPLNKQTSTPKTKSHAVGVSPL